jgi:hypothetical protein
MWAKFDNRGSASREADRRAHDLRCRFQSISASSFRKPKPKWRTWSFRTWLSIALFAVVVLYLSYSWIWNSNLWPSQQIRLRTLYISSCAQARRIGLAPLYRGLPGYLAALDADRDGIACEPHPF